MLFGTVLQFQTPDARSSKKYVLFLFPDGNLKTDRCRDWKSFAKNLLRSSLPKVMQFYGGRISTYDITLSMQRSGNDKVKQDRIVQYKVIQVSEKMRGT